MDSILLPTKLEVTAGSKPNEGVLTLEPCFYGYGTTVGNALRRVLLSSLPGAAVTAVKIRGAQHEFSSLPHVKEDVLEIILNLKLLRLKLHTDEPTKITLHVKGEQAVTAADFEKNSNVEIANPELHIATLTDKKADFEMEVVVERGRGYVPTEARPKAPELGMIMVDALFSPVRGVGYKVVNTRVGEITNYDRLVMTIETDGTITPEDAVNASAKVLLDYFALLLNNPGEAKKIEEIVATDEETAAAVDAMLPEEEPAAEVSELPTLEDEAGDVIAGEDVAKPKKRGRKPKAKE